MTLAGYEQIETGMAGPIVRMAEIEVESRSRDRGRLVRSEARSVVVATWLVGVLPYTLVAATIWLAYLGQPTAASLAALATALSFGPKIIAAIRSDRSDETSEG